MAVRKSTNHKPARPAGGSQITNSEPEKPIIVKPKEGKWVVLGWVLLLFGGLAHMLPEQMAPLVKWSLWGVSLQMAVGVGSVILALNFLLED